MRQDTYSDPSVVPDAAAVGVARIAQIGARSRTIESDSQLNVNNCVHMLVSLVVVLTSLPRAGWSAAEFSDYVGTSVPIEVPVAVAEHIAIIKLRDRQPVSHGGVTCGFRYRAEVLMALKGGTEEFQIFIPNELRIRNPGSRQLVMAFPRVVAPAATFDTLFAYQSRAEFAKSECRAGAAPFFLMDMFPTIWEFVDGLEPGLRGEWILANRVDGSFEWCYSNDGAIIENEPRHFRRFESRRLSHREPGRIIVSWPAVRELIVRALKNSPYPAGSTAKFSSELREDFVPGGCD